MSISNIGGGAGGFPPQEPNEPNKAGDKRNSGHFPTDGPAKRTRSQTGADTPAPRASIPQVSTAQASTQGDTESRVTGVRIDTQMDPKAADAALIRTALQKTASDPDARVLVVGYSPTGGGHTDRCLNIVRQALEQDTLKANSTVILHVPSKWNNQKRPGSLDALAKSLMDKGISVVMCGEADKSVQGFLKEDGSSDDAKILSRFAQLPNRPDADAKSVLELKVYNGPGDLDNLPSISAKDLMSSLKTQLQAPYPPRGPGDDPANRPDLMPEKVLVLTDMDYSLQKAAAQAGVPGNHRLDQQNHALLIDRLDGSKNIDRKNAVLAKVLGGTGEQVSHIGLGDKNTLLNAQKSATALQISNETTKAEAMTKVADFLLKYGQEAHVAAASGQTEGVMKHSSLQDARHVNNIVYVYAHKNQDPIAQQIKAELDKGAETSPDYKNTLFVFCGKAEALKLADMNNAGLGGASNVMHAAYLAQADGITTCGAGTNGEFAYLNKAGGSQARLLALPIQGHNEQEANANYLANDPHTQPFTVVPGEDDRLPDMLDAFVVDSSRRATQKYGTGTMQQILTAIGDKDSYVQQAHDILFTDKPNSAEGRLIEEREKEMRDSPLLKANRQFMKMTFQVLDQMAERIQQRLDNTSTSAESLRVSLQNREISDEVSFALSKKDKDNGQEFKFRNLKDFVDNMLSTNDLLTTKLNSGVELKDDNVALLRETRNFFNQALSSSTPVSDADLLSRIDQLKEKFGHHLTTGF